MHLASQRCTLISDEQQHADVLADLDWADNVVDTAVYEMGLAPAGQLHLAGALKPSCCADHIIGA